MSNTVKLLNYSEKQKQFELETADSYPGTLMERTTGGKMQPNASANDLQPQVMFLLEQSLVGGTVNEKITTGNKAQAWLPERGDEVGAILADGNNASYGDLLASDGNGLLQTTSTAGAAVARALEAKDLSASSGVESEGPLGYDARIMVEVL